MMCSSSSLTSTAHQVSEYDVKLCKRILSNRKLFDKTTPLTRQHFFDHKFRHSRLKLDDILELAMPIVPEFYHNEPPLFESIRLGNINQVMVHLCDNKADRKSQVVGASCYEYAILHEQLDIVMLLENLRSHFRDPIETDSICAAVFQSANVNIMRFYLNFSNFDMLQPLMDGSYQPYYIIEHSRSGKFESSQRRAYAFGTVWTRIWKEPKQYETILFYLLKWGLARDKAQFLLVRPPLSEPREPRIQPLTPSGCKFLRHPKSTARHLNIIKMLLGHDELTILARLLTSDCLMPVEVLMTQHMFKMSLGVTIIIRAMFRRGIRLRNPLILLNSFYHPQPRTRLTRHLQFFVFHLLIWMKRQLSNQPATLKEFARNEIISNVWDCTDVAAHRQLRNSLPISLGNYVYTNITETIAQQWPIA